ncbi:type I toxin-antitoxin system Ibs family toxin [Escherichia coli]|nr:type I toxin-antitoxin system Ibs family toxin [Escherichia coli]MCA8566808.1 type I toxin-antitoxin system Ibs family toxin [Escherichia coli]MCA8733709.1 type I toxin-antitoxin system Ibs family toxin [Escherichia coli]
MRKYVIILVILLVISFQAY